MNYTLMTPKLLASIGSDRCSQLLFDPQPLVIGYQDPDWTSFFVSHKLFVNRAHGLHYRQPDVKEEA